MSQLPLFEPETTWVQPKSLPAIPSGVVLAVDTETKDEGLANNRGPGWVFKTGYILGVSVAFNDEEYYIPIRHPDTQNFDSGEVMAWIADGMARAKKVVFQNRPYDEGWFSVYDVPVPEDADDTLAMSVMIDENRYSYQLDDLCKWQGIKGKDETLLREAAAAFGIKPNNVKAEMWKLPARHVGVYGGQDATATLRLYEKLLPLIEEQDLMPAYRLERDLIPMTLAMRRRGIRINEGQAVKTMRELDARRDLLIEELRHRVGDSRLDMDWCNSPAHLERMFDAAGVNYPRTPKTNRGSFKSDWMKDSDHWLPSTISKVRALNDMSGKFIQTYLLDASHVGRVHAEIHMLRDGDSGTRSYRVSYSNPPLQQMPARDPDLAPLVRSILEPERKQLWVSGDYSQQEPRMAVHFAVLCKLAGSQAALEYYRDNPAADFHQMVSDLTGIPRKAAKIINLGLMYGMGLKKLAFSLGISVEEATLIVAQYNDRMPFVAALAEFCEGRAKSKGFIRLLDGARCRFDMFEPSWREAGEAYSPPMTEEAARAKWPGRKLKRSMVHKAMNRLVQGSAARQTKMAMLECARQGIIPLIQMHDELGFSMDSMRDVNLVEEIMRDVVQLKVPMKVDMQLGYNWGQASEEAPKGTEPPTMEELLRHGPGVANKEIYRARAA